MVLVVRYRVTIDLLFLSSPNPQPIQFLIFSSPPPPRYPLVKEFLSSFVFKSLSMESVFPQSSLSLSRSHISCPLSLSPLFYLISPSLFLSSSPFLLLPFLHTLLSPFSFGLLAIIKVFSHPSSVFSLSPPRLAPSLSLHCPLIFMRIAGQPRSASLSLSVGEEAA